MGIEKKYGNVPVNALLQSVLPVLLAFAGLLPIDAGAAQQAIARESQKDSAAQEKEMTQGVQSILATVIHSRSTNSRGYKLVIFDDGSATAEIGGAGMAPPAAAAPALQFPSGAIDTKTLRRLLTAIGDVTRIPTGGCIKSVSFGTRTQITYANKTSGDLQCIQQRGPDGDQALLQASEELGEFVQTALSHLKINDRRIGSPR
jgi:hypothetical protein